MQSQIAKKGSEVNAGKFSYTYTSLADFAKQGFKIPQMRTTVDQFGEFIEYKDDDGAWQRGARVVIPEDHSRNLAQNYGGALSYARRYTVALYLGIATDDDESVETIKPHRGSKPQASGRLDFEDVKVQLDKCESVTRIDEYSRKLAADFPNLTDKQKGYLKKLFDTARSAVEGRAESPQVFGEEDFPEQ